MSTVQRVTLFDNVQARILDALPVSAGTVSDRSRELQQTAHSLSAAAEQTSRQSGMVAEAAQTAKATEEIGSQISGGILQRMAGQAEATGRAPVRTPDAAQTLSGLVAEQPEREVRTVIS